MRNSCTSCSSIDSRACCQEVTLPIARVAQVQLVLDHPGQVFERRKRRGPEIARAPVLDAERAYLLPMLPATRVSRVAAYSRSSNLRFVMEAAVPGGISDYERPV